MKAQTKIREWCERDGRKLGWIARQISVDQSSFSRWMSGLHVPRSGYRKKIAEITGIEEVQYYESWVNP